VIREEIATLKERLAGAKKALKRQRTQRFLNDVFDMEQGTTEQVNTHKKIAVDDDVEYLKKRDVKMTEKVKVRDINVRPCKNAKIQVSARPTKQQ
jgi:hypothetical protein